MAANTLRYYLDENLPVEIARQLRLRGIDAVTVRDLGRLGEPDSNHLHRATDMGMVLCTFDTDFIELVAAGQQHAGIVLGQQDVHEIGAWVRYLELMHTVYSAEDMQDHIEYL
ncbi:MAG TPA: DUF5615 family PIN-like protein [Promineifilum sp.]|nr:DUF5615 family PIN-like protein [Promineifilum sp.]HQF70191.1 DUF5615 family PIN-like protein [Promineifilum sp.]